MDKKRNGRRRTHLQARATSFDGEYEMIGDGPNVLELTERIFMKAKKMLNPKGLPEVKFNDKWTYFKGRSQNEITKEEFIRDGGSFEYIAWSDYAGGNRFEVSGGIFEDVMKWVFIGHGRFS